MWYFRDLELYRYSGTFYSWSAQCRQWHVTLSTSEYLQDIVTHRARRHGMYPEPVHRTVEANRPDEEALLKAYSHVGKISLGVAPTLVKFPKRDLTEL